MKHTEFVAQVEKYLGKIEPKLNRIEKNIAKRESLQQGLKPQIVHYDDWGHFIQMPKTEWGKVKRWLKAHGVEVEETGQDGPRTKYRRLK